MSKKSAKASQSLKIPRTIILTGKFLQFISPRLATAFASRLFTTPVKHKIPRRELEMDHKSIQEKVHIDSIGKDIVVYHYGEGKKRILLVHGWSGRGTQLVKFADELVKLGYSTVSFDAPAHGKSSGKTTMMPEFIQCIFRIEKEYGPFDAAVGHSLGGMSLLNSVKRGLKLDKLVVIGSGDIIQNIIDEFVVMLQMKPKIGQMMREHFEKISPETMDSYSSYIAAGQVSIPVLIIHDENDHEVSVECARHIHGHLKNGELMVTRGLGHRKILGSHQVIERSLSFIKN